MFRLDFGTKHQILETILTQITFYLKKCRANFWHVLLYLVKLILLSIFPNHISVFHSVKSFLFKVFFISSTFFLFVMSYVNFFYQFFTFCFFIILFSYFCLCLVISVTRSILSASVFTLSIKLFLRFGSLFLFPLLYFNIKMLMFKNVVFIILLF